MKESFRIRYQSNFEDLYLKKIKKSLFNLNPKLREDGSLKKESHLFFDVVIDRFNFEKYTKESDAFNDFYMYYLSLLNKRSQYESKISSK